jgi:hypothetical protein
LHYTDTFGSEQYIPHIGLFDMVHFNSFYPKVPRLVRCEQEQFTEYKCDGLKWTVPLDKEGISPTPILGTKQHKLFGQYKRYSALQQGSDYAPAGERSSVDLAILQGAQRPHPFMQEIIDNLLQQKFGNNDDSSYMTLHARVEPDMLAHNVCPGKKEGNLTKIFQYLEQTFPDPPAKFVFMPINREYMEEEGYPNKKDPSKTNWMAVENLNALNNAVKNGLWGGRAKVFEFGARMLKGTRVSPYYVVDFQSAFVITSSNLSVLLNVHIISLRLTDRLTELTLQYERRSSIVGAMVNYYVALGGNVFVGTEISSYAMDLLAARFYRGIRENYKYGPNGLERWTQETDQHPPNFVC